MAFNGPIVTQTTSQRNAGVSTATGTLIYNSDREAGQIYGGNTKGWVDFGKSQTFIFSETGYYTTSGDASADNLYAYWNCNSTSTSKTLGSSGSATLYGVSSGSGWISSNWDRGTSYSNGINLTSMPTGTNMTIAFAFIMTDSTIHSSSDGAGLLWLDSTTSSSVILGYDGSTRVLRAGGNGWVSDGTVIINPLSTNTWYHIVVTKSSNDWKYYVNGSNVHNVSESMNNNGNWWFSNYSRHTGNTNNHYHRGRLDEIAIWERTLTQAEITALYNAQSAGTPLYNP